MNFRKKPLFSSLSIILLLAACQERFAHDGQGSGAGVVYGEDSRREVRADDALSVAQRRAAEATAAFFPANRLVPEEGGFRVSAPTLAQANRLCEGVPFREQTSASYCSAVLIAPNRILTAGHCLPVNAETCNGQRLVFGWTLERGNKLGADDVYGCTRVLRLERDGGEAERPDMALVELDRDVVGREPVPVSFEDLKAGEAVFGAAYPNGIPLKLFDGSIFQPAAGTPYAKAEIDTFSGGSGGPIFSMDGTLRALLIGGEADYEWANGPGSCRRLRVCKNLEDCGGEYLLQLKPEHLEPRPLPPAPPPKPSLADSILNHP